MPELAELRLTAEYINLSSEEKEFFQIEKNYLHKGEDLIIPYSTFKIKASSRGKELVLYLYQGESLNTEYIPIRMNMGMSGHFQLTQTGKEAKHAHLKFYSLDGYTLSFVDVRRFGRWKLAAEWSSNRGPDPTLEFQNFITHIKNNLHKVAFDKPICEVLMNQKYFNGIGNYLRAEILYRVDINPFMSAREALTNNPEIYQLCQWAPTQAYKLGGGELKDWENPFNYKTEINSWQHFMLCYNNQRMCKVLDKNGRTFWFDPKWQKL